MENNDADDDSMVWYVDKHDDDSPAECPTLPMALCSALALQSNPLVTTGNDSILHIMPSGEKMNVSRLCLNQLEYFRTTLQHMESDPRQWDRVRHEFINDTPFGGNPTLVKRQVFVIYDEYPTTLKYIVRALHCLPATKSALMAIVRESHINGDIVLLLQHCGMCLYHWLAHLCRKELARIMRDPEETSVSDMLDILRLFDQRNGHDDVDASFATKKEDDILGHPIMLAVLLRLRVMSANELTAAISTSEETPLVCIPSYLLLKLVVFSGTDSDIKRRIFTQALLVRAMKWQQAEESNKTHPRPIGWDLVALNMCRENGWKTEALVQAIHSAMVRSIAPSLRHTPLSEVVAVPQSTPSSSSSSSSSSSYSPTPATERNYLTAGRRTMSDNRFDREQRRSLMYQEELLQTDKRQGTPSPPTSRLRTVSHPRTASVPPLDWLVDVDTSCAFSSDTTIVDTNPRETSQPIQVELRRGRNHTTAPYPLPLVIFLVREKLHDVKTSHASQAKPRYCYRLCLKLATQMNAMLFTGVLGMDVSKRGIEEICVQQKRVSMEPLILATFFQETHRLPVIAIRLYGVLSLKQ